MEKELNKIYDPKEVEDRLYEFWENNNYFHAEPDKSKNPYTIVIPPPNITGKLHMGHALDETLQDIIVRFKRMQGFMTLWLPGTDHASIATEAKVVNAIKEEGLSKEELGREEFLKRTWQWKEQYGNTIVNQIKKLGASCDWSRERFTLDEGCSKAVIEFFNRMYEKKLIYRGERIINWCPKCKTSISDIEVVFDETDGKFWHIKYPFADGSGSLEIATTRPETMLGDTAIAVSPDDDRYKDIIGKSVIVPLINKEIPVVADSYVEKDFGTGAVKITPAHDPNDFEVGKRHNLKVINIMDDNCVMNENAGKYKGLDRYEARKQIVEDLKQAGFLVKVEDIHHTVGKCQRCSEVVEPRVSTQWFVKMEPLAKPAIECVKSGEVKFIPERFSKIYYNWMENIKDWCISRQLWWGHRIPAWYCEDCGEVNVSREEVKECGKCGSHNLHQDEDTLDTWFSSALWPFSTLGWPEKTPELDYFFPTDTLVTGYDIIFFWVARMIFASKELMGDVPFKNVLIHGLVRDAQGRKMSKSLGNGIDPLEIIDKYGADALRFTLAIGNSPGNDIRFSDEKVSSSRNFANKIWNAARFIHMNIKEKNVQNKLPENMNTVNKWIVSRFNNVAREVTSNIEKFELGLAVQKLYDFVWDEFCDWYIEFAKVNMQNESVALETMQVLVWVMSNTMKLLHPFMPFITEEIWQSLPHDGESIMVSKYPCYDSRLDDKVAEDKIKDIMEVIKCIRNRRSEMNVQHNKKTAIYISTLNTQTYQESSELIKKLAYGTDVKVANEFNISQSVTIVTTNAKVYIPLDELIDKQAEIARLKKEYEETKKYLEQSQLKLKNEKFISKAPEKVINGVKDNVEKLKSKLSEIENTLKSMEN